MTHYTTVSLFIIAVAVFVKFVLGRYVKGVGENINSQALVASGSDAFFDGVLSLSTLVAAIISLLYNISLEGILGVVISLVIIKASLNMLKETLDNMIGLRIDSDLSKKIKDSVEEFDEVYGAYDLSLHSYGPEDMQGSIHIEVSDDLTSRDIHKLTREIRFKVYREFSIILTIGIYAKNAKFSEIYNNILDITKKYEEVLQVHGFYVDEEKQLVSFDMIVDFDANRDDVKEKILNEIKIKYPQFNYFILDDYDVSD